MAMVWVDQTNQKAVDSRTSCGTTCVLFGNSRLILWIYQIARHAIIDHYSVPGRRREISAGLAADIEAYQSSSTTQRKSENSDQLCTELARCLGLMIEHLSEEYRQGVVLADLEGLTQQEAAVQLGL
jgi:RNA polymerase sigma-70 factor, ECF subfamily